MSYRGRSQNIQNLQGGRKRLPKFKFSAKFPIGLHVILQIQIKKFENDCYIMWKIILTKNPSRFNVEPSWNNVKWILFVNYTVIRMLYMKRSRKSVLPHWIELYRPPPPPENLNLFAYFCSFPLRSTPLQNRLKSFQYEMRAIFTESLVYETLFNTVVYGSDETHIIMHNLKTKNGNQLKFWK